MKKIFKILLPLLSITGVAAISAPFIVSCSSGSTLDTNVRNFLTAINNNLQNYPLKINEFEFRDLLSDKRYYQVSESIDDVNGYIYLDGNTVKMSNVMQDGQVYPIENYEKPYTDIWTGWHFINQVGIIKHYITYSYLSNYFNYEIVLTKGSFYSYNNEDFTNDRLDNAKLMLFYRSLNGSNL